MFRQVSNSHIWWSLGGNQTFILFFIAQPMGSTKRLFRIQSCFVQGIQTLWGFSMPLLTKRSLSNDFSLNHYGNAHIHDSFTRFLKFYLTFIPGYHSLSWRRDHVCWSKSRSCNSGFFNNFQRWRWRCSRQSFSPRIQGRSSGFSHCPNSSI